MVNFGAVTPIYAAPPVNPDAKRLSEQVHAPTRSGQWLRKQVGFNSRACVARERIRGATANQRKGSRTLEIGILTAQVKNSTIYRLAMSVKALRVKIYHVPATSTACPRPIIYRDQV